MAVWSRIVKNKWLVFAISLAVILAFLQIARRNTKFEGFTQSEPFVSKRGAAAFDEFYAEIYDRLYKTKERSVQEAVEIIRSTQPDKENSFFLDVGCGTGCLVDELIKQGYQATGVDRSEAMIEVGKERRSKCRKPGAIKVADVSDSMLFERGTFTHILCMDRTIYDFEDKVAFLRNCRHWLRGGGYLVLHLVEPTLYNPVVPLGQPSRLLGKHAPKKTADGKRITDTSIDFVDYKYNSCYDFSQLDKGIVVQTETFTDATSNNVRRNEHTMYMTGPGSILEDARYCGFLLMGEFVSTQDPEQKVVILKA